MKPILLIATTAVALAFGPAVVMAQGAHEQAPAMQSSNKSNTFEGYADFRSATCCKMVGSKKLKSCQDRSLFMQRIKTAILSS